MYLHEICISDVVKASSRNFRKGRKTLRKRKFKKWIKNYLGEAKGGTSKAIDKAGPIEQHEVGPTLQFYQRQLHQLALSEAEFAPFKDINILHYALGSTGKKKWSGDLDVAVKVDEADIPAFKNMIKRLSGAGEMQRHGNTISLGVDVQDYNEQMQPTVEDYKALGKTVEMFPRTGITQLDFMFGNPEWLKHYYHSPSQNESEHKGVYRTLLLRAVASNIGAEKHLESDSRVTDANGNHPEINVITKWKLSPKEGIVRVERRPKPNKKGTGYTKAFDDTMVTAPMIDPNVFLKELDIKATTDHSNPINSVESLLAGINHMDNDSKHNIMVEWVKLIEQNGLDIPAKFASYASE